MRVYFDTSALNRIFDDQSQPRIYLEASAMLLVFSLLESGALSLVSSEALRHENSRNPFADRRLFVTMVLRQAKVIQTLSPVILKRAVEIEATIHIKGYDALHLACAEKVKAGFFITCDDRIIKRYSGKLNVMNPVDFARLMVQEP